MEQALGEDQFLCIHCNKRRSVHQSGTLFCPIGVNHRTLGYMAYAVTVFRPNPKKKIKQPAGGFTL